MKEQIQNLVESIQAGNSQAGWQKFFFSLGLKGNENTKGEKPIPVEVANQIFIEIDLVLKNIREDILINEILDGIHNLITFMAIEASGYDIFNQIHDTYHVSI